MGFPPIYEDIFQNEGEGPLVRPDILPDIELTGDTTGKASCGEDGQWTVETTTPMAVELTGDVVGSGSVENGVISIDTTAMAASALAKSITIKLTGDVVGEVEFDGSENVEIGTTGLFSEMSNTTDRLKDPVTIALDGDVEGSAKFDGSDDLTIHVTANSSATADLAKEAAKLETSRTIEFVGDTTGTYEFDGTEDKSVELTTDVATKLREAQYVKLTGMVSGTSSAPFDGTDEVVINTTFTAGGGPMVPSADEPTQRYTGTWYTADTNGYIVIFYGCMQACYVTVHNITHRLYQSYDETGISYIPVAAGQEYTILYEGTWNGVPAAWWLPAY